MNISSEKKKQPNPERCIFTLYSELNKEQLGLETVHCFYFTSHTKQHNEKILKLNTPDNPNRCIKCEIKLIYY